MSFRKIDNHLNIFATGDLHLSHNLNRTIQKRGFNNPEQHTTFVRNQINSVVKNKSDILVLGGDLGDIDLVRMLINSLTTCNCWILQGNHDEKKQLLGLRNMDKVWRVEENIYINWHDNLFHLSHLPHVEFQGFYRNAYHPHFHTHGTMEPYCRAMDCGLDAHGMLPISLDRVVELRQAYSNIDEYGKRIEINISKQK